MNQRPPEGPWQPTPWTPHLSDPECQHVPVQADCEDSFCRIPAGCFVYGISEESYGAPVGAYQVSVTLTHSFEIGQTEFTFGMWEELGFARPTQGKDWKDPPPVCEADDCPVEYVGWYDALAAANAYSKAKGLPECYELINCQGSPGGQSSLDGFKCEEVRQTTENIYACRGYRLPTDVEWEYAARAGTQTAFHQGEIEPSPREGAFADLDCYEIDALGESDWYCKNSTRGARPVARLKPNRWGLYDVLGNVNEYTSSSAYSLLREAQTDPQQALDDSRGLIFIRSGNVINGPSPCRAGWKLPTIKQSPLWFMGFRLARSLD